jgi:hypothetical protein
VHAQRAAARRGDGRAPASAGGGEQRGGGGGARGCAKVRSQRCTRGGVGWGDLLSLMLPSRLAEARERLASALAAGSVAGCSAAVRLCGVASERSEGALVSAPFPSFARPVLTDISLCRACSCQEILRAETARQAQLREAVALVRDPANLLVSRGKGAGTTDAAVLIAGSSTEGDPGPAPAFDAAPVLARASAAASACEAAEQQRSHTTVLWLGMRAQATRSEARALGQQAAALVRQLRDEEEEQQPESLCVPPDDDVGAAAAAHAPQPYHPPAHSDPRWESALESGALTVDRCPRPRLSCWSRRHGTGNCELP